MTWLKKRARSTGLYDLTSLVPGVEGGALRLERAESTTWLFAEALVVPANGNPRVILPAGTLPVGLKGSRSQWVELVVGSSSRRLAFAASGAVLVYNTHATESETYRFTLPFLTPGPMPDTIPGVKL